jgi:hypothetical protein
MSGPPHGDPSYFPATTPGSHAVPFASYPAGYATSSTPTPAPGPVFSMPAVQGSAIPTSEVPTPSFAPGEFSNFQRPLPSGDAPIFSPPASLLTSGDVASMIRELHRNQEAMRVNQEEFQTGIQTYIVAQQSASQSIAQASLAQTQASQNKVHGGTVKVRNPRMFNGRHEEVTPFLSELHRIMEFNPASFQTDYQRVMFAALYLKDGVPVEWFGHLESSDSPVLRNWTAFITEFKKKFADPRLTLTADQRLDRLRQTGSAFDYLTRFLELSSHLDMTEQTKINRFMKGLKPAIKDNLVSIVDRPDTLAAWENTIIQIDANLHQREVERKDEGRKLPPLPKSNHLSVPSHSHSLPSSSTSSSSTLPVPMDVDALSTSPSTLRNGSRPRGKLTQEERASRIAKGLCLYCGKPGHSVDNCFARKARHGDASTQGKVLPKTK